MGDDTAPLSLLSYYSDVVWMFTIYSRRINRSQNQDWDIKMVKRFGESMDRGSIFINAILGCNTTSRLHSINKNISLKEYAKPQVFRDQPETLNASGNSVQNIISSGEKAQVTVYNGKATDSLNTLRY